MGDRELAGIDEGSARVVELDDALAAQLPAFRAAFAKAGESHIPALPLPAELPAEEAVAFLAALARDAGSPADGVPATTRFLVVSGVLVGVFTLRHRLNDALRKKGGHVGYSVRPTARNRGYATQLLASAVSIAAGLGISRLLVTCDPLNLASRRVIEKSGGVFSDEYFNATLDRGVRRYWLSVPQ